ncbi:MAG: FixH family protein [Armatimonadetes bacterium]|nr:FixH family protein [Armatimonadota bacterium]MDE2205553.1 FixH family protein [Armatimonadota bacterium]
MPDYSDAPLKEARQYVVTGSEDWASIRGFGTHSTDVAMMTEMMVKGSAMEGMRMNGMAGMAGMPGMTTPGRSTTPGAAGSPGPLTLLTPMTAIRRGANTLAFALAANGSTKPAGLHMAATVKMTAMDMGESHPPVVMARNGRFSVKVDFSMAGAWQVSLQIKSGGQPPQVQSFDFDVP